MKYIILQCKKVNKALLEQTLTLNIPLKYQQILRGFWSNLDQYAILESHFNYFKLLRILPRYEHVQADLALSSPYPLQPTELCRLD